MANYFYSHFINSIPIYLYCTLMTSSAKPVHEYFKHLQYLRHKTKLATIQQQRVEPETSELLQSVHKLRSQAQTFHQMQQENAISSSNEKLLQKLLSISKRRPSAYSQTVACPVMNTFRNPARKKRERMITEMNQQMAQRMLTRGSQLGQSGMRRSIQQYQRIKKTIANNKRALSLSHTAQLPAITLNRSRRTVKLDKDQLQRHHSAEREEVHHVEKQEREQGRQYSKHQPILIRYEQTEQQHVQTKNQS